MDIIMGNELTGLPFLPQIGGVMPMISENMIKNTLFSDEFLEMINENTMPVQKLFTYFQCAIYEIETKFKVLNEEFSLRYDRNPIETIKTRIKSTESIMKKIRKKNLSLDINSIEQNIDDIAGVRVICSFPDDIYMLADCLLQQDDIILLERKDYIKNPKPSGYRSLHLIVEVPIFLHNEKRLTKVEVQLRTIAMDFWASLEHKLRYKKNIPDSEAAVLAEELNECAVQSALLDEKMQVIREKIYSLEYRKNIP